MNRAPISSHYTLDDARWYSFERNSRIAYGTFAETFSQRIARLCYRVISAPKRMARRQEDAQRRRNG